MRRLAKNFIVTTAVVSAIFFVDPASASATLLNEEPCTVGRIYLFDVHRVPRNYIDFWSKFRDTVMPDPNKPQDNNPPKETRKSKPGKSKPMPPPDKVEPKPED